MIVIAASGGRIGVSFRRHARCGRRAGALARIGARRAGVDRDLSSRTGPRPNGWSSAACWTCGGWSSSSACTARTPRSATLNRTGILVAPDADMVALLKASLQFCRDHRRRVRSDRAAAVAALCRSFLVGKAGSRRSAAAEAGGSAGQSRPRRPARERRPHRADQAWRRHHAERHRAGLRHRPRREMFARPRAVDDPRQYGRDTRDRGETRGHTVARRPCRSRHGPARSPKPSTSSIARSRPRRVRAFASTPAAALRICSIPRRDAVPRAIAPSASLRRPPPKRTRFRPHSA